MAVTAELEEVTTEDAAPTAAPFKISAKATKDTVSFKLNAVASSTIRALRVRFSPSNRNTGKLLFSRGMVCGTGDRCGTSTAFSLSHASPMVTAAIVVADALVASEPDGEYTVKAWPAADEGWSS